MRPFAGHKHHWRKKHHRANHGEQNGFDHLSHTPQRRGTAIEALALRGMNRFSDDNGIVYNNAEHQQEGEQGDHVQTHSRVGQ